ncbi:MAG: ADP-ribosylation factor-like protein, partial [Chloroflexota bacterium]
MAHDEAYYQAEKKIEEALKSGATELNLSNMKLAELPESIGQLTQLKSLALDGNQIEELPDSIANLKNLTSLWLGEKSIGGNPLGQLPEYLRGFKAIEILVASKCNLKVLPDWLGEFKKLKKLYFTGNQITDLPLTLSQLDDLKELKLDSNPLNPELAEAYKQGIDAVKLYLRAGAVIPVYEAKLILIGEGEVGKTCLMDALLGKEWQEHSSTHGIEIQQVKVTLDVLDVDEDYEEFGWNKKTEITLNAWDFGGQRVYRPTHQLFFSAPAVYLVVWKPREGSQAGQVKEWIQLVKRREPSAKILVVATHGGPQQRQPDIDRQELWDLFGKETVVDFFFVESKPDPLGHGNRKGIDKLKRAIAQVAASLPEVGRSVPKSFADVRQALQDKGAPYL